MRSKARMLKQLGEKKLASSNDIAQATERATDASARLDAEKSRLKVMDDAMKKTAKGKHQIDWSRADAMTAEQRRAVASADPDNKPMTDAEWAAAPRVPQVSVIRRALKLSQEDFAGAFQIPIGTLRDWEQGRKEPDAAARAYLRVIAREPDAVRKALASASRSR